MLLVHGNLLVRSVLRHRRSTKTPLGDVVTSCLMVDIAGRQIEDITIEFSSKEPPLFLVDSEGACRLAFE